jgi:hypothetical protein
MASVRRARGILNINPKKTVSVTGRANVMCDGIDESPTVFPSPSVPTATVRNQVTVVNKCESQVKTRAIGTASARDVQRTILVGMLENNLTYIQGCADKATTYDQAVSVLQSGGVVLAGVAQHQKEVIEIKQGPTPGSVVLDANVGMLTAGLKGKFSFNWQSTVDGKVYTTLPSTPNHLTTVANLPTMTSVGFRVSITDAKGVMGEWSQMVPICFPTVELRAVA